MGVSIRATRVACNTSTGDQDITISGFGTPKAAMFQIVSATTDATAAAHAIWSVGYTDGTNHAVVGARSRDNWGTSTNVRRGATDEIIMVLNPTDTNVDGEANFSTWITDGVRITWGAALGSAYLLIVTLFNGSDLTANAGSFTSNSSGGTNDVDCGFTPEMVLFASHGTSLGDTTSTASPMNLGFSVDDTVIENVAATQVGRDAVGTTQTLSWSENDRCVVNLNASGDNVSRSLSVTAYLSGGTDGFEITHHSGAHTNALTTSYLAISLGGTLGIQAGIYTTPTSTGDDAVTGVGFTPQFVMLLMPAVTTINTGAQDGRMGAAMFTASDEYSWMVCDEDNVGTTNAQTISDDTAVNYELEAGGTDGIASFSSMDADGWTLNYSNALAGAYKWPFLAIEEDAAAAVGTGPFPTFRPQIS